MLGARENKIKIMKKKKKRGRIRWMETAVPASHLDKEVSPEPKKDAASQAWRGGQAM